MDGHELALGVEESRSGGAWDIGPQPRGAGPCLRSSGIVPDQRAKPAPGVEREPHERVSTHQGRGRSDGGGRILSGGKAQEREAEKGVLIDQGCDAPLAPGLDVEAVSRDEPKVGQHLSVDADEDRRALGLGDDADDGAPGAIDDFSDGVRRQLLRLGGHRGGGERESRRERHEERRAADSHDAR